METRLISIGAVVETIAAINCSNATLKGKRWISELGYKLISAAVCNSLKVILPNPKSANFWGSPISA